MNSEDDESLLNCLAELEQSEINLSTETEQILSSEEFTKTVLDSVHMTCSKTLPSDNSHRSEESDKGGVNRHEECAQSHVSDQARAGFSSEDELPLSVVRKVIRAGKAVLDETWDVSVSSSDEYIPQQSRYSSDSPLSNADTELEEDQSHDLKTCQSTPAKFKTLTNTCPGQPQPEQFNIDQSARGLISDHNNVAAVLQCPPTPTTIFSTGQQDAQEEVIRGRRKKRRTKEERDAQALERLNTKMRRHSVLEGCASEKCPKKCHDNFDQRTREDINDRFWRMDYVAQKLFIRQIVTVEKCRDRKKKDVNVHRKGSTKMYTFRKTDGHYQSVCQLFFLNTLGLKGSNDKIVRKAFETVEIKNQSNTPAAADIRDKRGSRGPVHKIDHRVIHEDIERYQPSVPHYRREHAPLRRYLPSELSLPEMYKRFMDTGKLKISYNTYYQAFKELNISFAKLGHEECETCAEFELHKKKCQCLNECTFYKKYIGHKQKYTEARQAYISDSEKSRDNITDHTIYSADLQKVVMLPMIEQFKRAIFTRRLCCFNETFASVGKMRSKQKDVAVIWHEAVAGRKDEDIASAYYLVFKTLRDAHTITLWLDNCGAQNKNWTLFTMLAGLINSDDTCAELITIKYFEPGHSFMSADTTHAKIEAIFRRKSKVIYDFRDLADCVREAGCIVHEPQHADFYQWVSGASQYQMKKVPNRPYLSDMVFVEFRRGKDTLFFKKTHKQAEATELAFLKASHDLCQPVGKNKQSRGVEPTKKQDILSHLLPLMPENRLTTILVKSASKRKE